MSESSLKDIRKQVRNVVKESMSDEFLKALETRITKDVMLKMEDRLNKIQAHLNSVLEAVDKRSKDVSISLLQAVPPSIPQLKA